MTNELMTIESVTALKGTKAIAVLSDTNQLKPLVEHVRKEALAVQYDVTTSKGRKDIGTAANNVVQSRKPIIEAIEKHISDLNVKVTGLKEAKSYVENEFKLIKVEVLKPRTEWQAEQDRIEKERVDEIKNRIENIRAIGKLEGTEDRKHIESLIEALEAQDLSTGFDELTQEAMQAKQEVITSLNARIMQIIEEINAAKHRIESVINGMKSKVADAMDFNKSAIGRVISDVESTIIDDSFGDRKEEALNAKEDAIKKLNKLYMMADDEDIVESDLPFLLDDSDEDAAMFTDSVADNRPDRVSATESHTDDILAHSMCEYMEGAMTLEQAHYLISMVRNN